MSYTGYNDVKGKPIYLGDYLWHPLEIDGDVTKTDDEYMFGGVFELKNYGADVRKIEEDD